MNFKRSSIILIALILVSTIPALYVYAGSGTCSGSSPVACALQDAFNLTDSIFPKLGQLIPTLIDSFHFTDNIPIIKLGTILSLSSITSDSFHLLDSSLNITISNNASPCTNPFNSGGCGNSIPPLQSGALNLGGEIVTSIGIPVVVLLAILFFGLNIGIKEFPILLGLAMFTILSLIWAKVLPSWSIIVPILFASAMLAMIVQRFVFGGSSSSNSEM